MMKVGGRMSFKNFNDFYPYYLHQHATLACRRLHFIGTCGVISLMILFFFTGNLILLTLIPLMGYGLAWPGHFLFERNRPATFRHPIYSLLGDFRMFWDILAGRVKAF
jgi:hypothetical protein